MKRIKLSILTIIVTAGLVTSLFSAQAFAVTEPEPIMAKTACVIDYHTKTVIYDKAKDERRQPASTTKIMTALLVLENLPLDTSVVIDSEVAQTAGNTLSFKDGEIITVEDLLYGLLLYSSNDTAVALAKAVSGTTSDFVKLMNERALEIGALNTHYVNPHGLTEDNHYSTAYDLTLIAGEAMKNSTFREIVKTPKYTISANFLSEEREIYNTNLLISGDDINVTVSGITRPAKYEEALGIKTGFTLAAGNCLVFSAERKGTTYIGAVLNSGELERFSDAIQLLEWSFLNYRTLVPVKKEETMGKVKVEGGSIIKAEVKGIRDSYLLIPNDAADTVVSTKIILDEGLVAPLSKGAVCGKVQIFEGDRLSDEVDLVLAYDVKKGTFLSYLHIPDKAGIPLIIGVLAIVALLILFAMGILIARAVVKRRNRIRRRELAREIAENRLKEQRDKENRNWRF